MCVVLALLGPGRAWAQMEEEDSEDEPAPAAAPAAKPGKAGKASDDGKPRLNLRLEEPAVRSVLESAPTTPSERIRAIETLLTLRRPELAKPLLTDLLASKPNAKALVGLAHEFGSATFLKIGGSAELAPQGGELADAVLSAAQAARMDPARLAESVRQLSSADPQVRQDAAAALASVHEMAITPLLKALADTSRSAEHPAERAMLARLESEAFGPLTGLLSSGDPALEAEAIKTFGQMKSTAAVPWLLAPALAASSPQAVQTAGREALTQILGGVPSAQDAAEWLDRDARAALDHARRTLADPAATVEVWQWDPAAQQAVSANVPPANAAALRAGHAAIDAAKLSAAAGSTRLAALAQLELLKLSVGLDHPLPPADDPRTIAARQLGAEALNVALADALEAQLIPAATAAAELLGEIGDPKLLVASGRKFSPLAEAARANDRRLRFAATITILKLKPTTPFPGAGLVAPNLAFFAGTNGFRRVLIGHPRTDRGQTLVGLMSGLDYEGEQVNRGRAFLDEAALSPDFELGLLHYSLNSPGVDDVIARLRRDPRTADLPIGLIVPEESRVNAERMVRSMPLVKVMPMVQTEAALRALITQVLDLAGRNLVSFAERQAQAATALEWLARISEEPQNLYDLAIVEPYAERALYVPALSRNTALVLSNLPSSTAQRAMVDVASRSVLPLETRREAAVAFGRSVRLHGVLLTGGQILEQYDRYNASRAQDRPTQEVLAGLLDAIEGRRQASTDDKSPAAAANPGPGQPQPRAEQSTTP